MAELITSQKQGRRKTKDPRIDLTPMVDLGFLLITFFIYTTTMAKPRTMELQMPDNRLIDKPTTFPKESTITLIPTKNHKIIYYSGTLDSIEQLSESNFKNDAITQLLIRKISDAKALPASLSKDAHALHVIIRPADDCTYEDVVTLLDDMNALNVRYYAMADLSDYENEMISKKSQ